MIFIILAILCSTAVSQILKLSDLRKYSTGSVFLLNYMVASLSAFIQADFSTCPSLDSASGIFFYVTALILGLLFIGAFFIFKKAINQMGVSPATTISRLSTGLPLAGSLIFFREYPTIQQALGMGLMLSAIPFAAKKNKGQGVHKWSPWGLLLFLAFGVNDFILKIVKEVWPEVSDYSFLFIVFATAGFTALILMLKNREKLSPAALLPGILLGLVNLGSALFVMKALNTLPAIIVYPTLSLGIILSGLITGLLFWKEKMTLSYFLFLLMALMAIILIS